MLEVKAHFWGPAVCGHVDCLLASEFHSIRLLSFNVYLKKRKGKRIHRDLGQNDRDFMVLCAVSSVVPFQVLCNQGGERGPALP